MIMFYKIFQVIKKSFCVSDVQKQIQTTLGNTHVYLRSDLFQRTNPHQNGNKIIVNP